MNIGFLTDVDGYRAPIHPESFEKYSMDLHLEKNIFDYLNYPDSKQENIKTISKLSDLDVIACVENIENKTIKGLKEGQSLLAYLISKRSKKLKN